VDEQVKRVSKNAHFSMAPCYPNIISCIYTNVRWLAFHIPQQFPLLSQERAFLKTKNSKVVRAASVRLIRWLCSNDFIVSFAVFFVNFLLSELLNKREIYLFLHEEM
jgi:hypothetical protein